MKRRAFLAGATLSIAGCTSAIGGSSLDEDQYDVGMSASAFEPTAVEIDRGETVVWGNTSGRAHTVTAFEEGIPDDAAYFASGDFASQAAAEEGWTARDGAIAVGDTYSHTFEVPGTYEYYCIPHRSMGMVGTVVVTD